MKKRPYSAKRDYKKYFYGFILLNVLYTSLCFILIFTVPYHNSNNWLFALADKMELLKHTRSPKIVFVGGSNLPFGLDCHLVEQQFKMPAIDMGLNRELGLKFILDVITPYVNKDDVVIVAPEYSHFFGRGMYGSVELPFVLCHVYPEGIRYINFAQLMCILEKNPLFVLNEAKSLVWNYYCSSDRVDYGSNPFSRAYDRRSFNELGDLVGHLKEKLDFEPYKRLSERLNPDAFTFLDQFHNTLQNKGIKVFYMFPAIQKATYYAELDNIELVRENIKALRFKTV